MWIGIVQAVCIKAVGVVGVSEWQWVGEEMRDEKVERESRACEKENRPSYYHISCYYTQ